MARGAEARAAMVAAADLRLAEAGVLSRRKRTQRPRLSYSRAFSNRCGAGLTISLGAPGGAVLVWVAGADARYTRAQPKSATAKLTVNMVASCASRLKPRKFFINVCDHVERKFGLGTAPRLAGSEGKNQACSINPYDALVRYEWALRARGRSCRNAHWRAYGPAPPSASSSGKVRSIGRCSLPAVTASQRSACIRRWISRTSAIVRVRKVTPT